MTCVGNHWICRERDPPVTVVDEIRADTSPLFLFVALAELRFYGGFGKVGERLLQAIHELPWLEDRDETGATAKPPNGASVITTIDDGLDALFGQILDRLKRETDRQAFDLSQMVFRLLATACDDLSQEELSGVLARALIEYSPISRNPWKANASEPSGGRRRRDR